MGSRIAQTRRICRHCNIGCHFWNVIICLRICLSLPRKINNIFFGNILDDVWFWGHILHWFGRLWHILGSFLGFLLNFLILLEHGSFLLGNLSFFFLALLTCSVSFYWISGFGFALQKATCGIFLKNIRFLNGFWRVLSLCLFWFLQTLFLSFCGTFCLNSMICLLLIDRNLFGLCWCWLNNHLFKSICFHCTLFHIGFLFVNFCKTRIWWTSFWLIGWIFSIFFLNDVLSVFKVLLRIQKTAIQRIVKLQKLLSQVRIRFVFDSLLKFF